MKYTSLSNSSVQMSRCFINVIAENNRSINNTSFFTDGLPCLHPRLYKMLVKKYGKEELSWKLILKKEEEKNKAALFGSPD